MKLSSVALAVFYFGFAWCEPEFQWVCKGKPIKNIQELYDSRNKCIARGVTDPFCQAVCSWKNFEMLDHLGNINEAGITNQLGRFLSLDDSSELQGKLKECIDTFKPIVTRLWPESEYYPTAGCFNRYFSFMKCIWVSAMSVCQTQFDPAIIGSEDIKRSPEIPLP